MAPISINKDTKRSANLRVLQRIDADIIDITASATHVVLYEFNVSSQAWEKRNCEGSLFVAKRSKLPYFKIVIMNRTSKENLEVPLSSTFQMQVREPYLIFRLEKGNNGGSNETVQKIRGIWFHSGKEREEICNVLDQIVKKLSSGDINENDSATTGEIDTIDRVQSMCKSEATASLLSALRIDESTNNDHTNDSNKQGDEDTQLLQNIELDKKSLQLSLMSLLQDDRFLDLIHAQYIKVVRARKGNTK